MLSRYLSSDVRVPDSVVSLYQPSSKDLYYHLWDVHVLRHGYLEHLEVNEKSILSFSVPKWWVVHD